MISPLTDPVFVDPNWRWYHKQEKSVDPADNPQNGHSTFTPHKSKTSTRALSAGDVISAKIQPSDIDGEDINPDEEFNDENSVVFSKISKQHTIDRNESTKTLDLTAVGSNSLDENGNTIDDYTNTRSTIDMVMNDVEILNKEKEKEVDKLYYDEDENVNDNIDKRPEV
eukprot:CAMPEP_0201569458 /NCGR_PEP_ID=MMETSP0190_2-20130828/11128_1 /ASSEMBLY_ACC=CAM_ASM_000263 /TAXON_ID=37353 /ORGANISM="Rosalina sp." /LENGTH=168 /DNA_ID=CAMNT_0047991761 /DNA_START=137 /DNA_END=643 /DNA_ORIENTATION=-